MKKKAILLLKEGKSIVEAEDLLMDYLKAFGVAGKTDNTKFVKKVRGYTVPLVFREEKKGCIVYRCKALECTIDDDLFKENREKINLAHSFP